MSPSDAVLQILRAWAIPIISSPTSRIDSIYVFGSLIHPDGDQFLPETSDVDLLAVMSGDESSPEARIEATIRLADAKIALEAQLASLLERDLSAPIVSMVLASPEDIAFGIHKNADSYDFFGRNHFLLLDPQSTAPCTLPPRWACETQDEDAVCAIRRAQTERNHYLASSADGSTQFQNWDDNVDPVPKELQRVAARVRHRVNGLSDFSHTYLLPGLEFLHDLVRELPDGSDPTATPQTVSFAQLKSWWGKRRGGRGKRTPMSPQIALSLWEILAEAAYAYIRPRMVQALPDRAPSDKSRSPDQPLSIIGDAEPTNTVGAPVALSLPGLHSPKWPLIHETASSLFVQGYPLVLVATANEYARLAEAMADDAATYLLWTVNGSPLNVRGWDHSDDRLTSWDRIFRQRQCDKMRVVVFRSEAERKEYISPSSGLRGERRARFEEACDHRLLFTSADLLRGMFPGLGAEPRLDIGFVSTEPPHLPRLGLCFYSPFATTELGAPAVRRAQVVLFDTGKLISPQTRDHEEVTDLLVRLQVHCEFIQAVRTGEGEVDEWLHTSAESVPPLADQEAAIDG
jgi:hypothetical protein